MKLPCEAPVMTLPNATLFPQALLPLYIFEPRYRKMLADVLQGERMFAVAMQKPESQRETPSAIAGLGFIRAAVTHKDGTSHLVLQGIARVELAEAMRYRPYRVHRMRPLESPPCDDAVADALVAQVRHLLAERFQLGIPFPFPVLSQPQLTSDAESAGAPPSLPAKELLKFLGRIANPDQVADLVSCALLAGAAERQAILETVNVEARLNQLIRFLLADLRRQHKGKAHE
jgi:Lon protease-like protein